MTEPLSPEAKRRAEDTFRRAKVMGGLVPARVVGSRSTTS